MATIMRIRLKIKQYLEMNFKPIRILVEPARAVP